MKNLKEYQLSNKGNSLFQDMIGLISQDNKEYRQALYEALGSFIDQVVSSILPET